MATIRKSCSNRHFGVDFRVEVSDVQRPKTDYEDGIREFAISSVDMLLPNAEAFIQGAVSGNINKHGLWEAFINELETACITKKERCGRKSRKGLVETVYSVPIVGYKQFLPPSTEDDYLPGAYNGYSTENPTDGFGSLQKSMIKQIKRNPSKFAFWMGRYYDTGLIYLHRPERSDHFKVIGNLQSPLPRLDHDATEFINGVSYRTFRRAALPSRVRVCHSNGGYRQDGGNWQQADPLDYLEINLEYPRHVTHIGTAGGYPRLTHFSTRKAVRRDRVRAYNAEERYDNAPLLSARGNGISRNKFSSYVSILKDSESDLSWVTSYEVHYRHHATHKWTLLLVTAANTDALTEVVLDLSPHFNSREGLFTQALRIRPLTHHRRPLMRVSVYGRDPQPSPVSAPTVGGHLSTADEEVGLPPAVVAGQDLPVIEYAVTTTRSKSECRYVRDGLQSSSRYYDYFGKGDAKFQKKKGWHATIRDEADSYYYEDELEF